MRGFLFIWWLFFVVVLGDNAEPLVSLEDDIISVNNHLFPDSDDLPHLINSATRLLAKKPLELVTTVHVLLVGFATADLDDRLHTILKTALPRSRARILDKPDFSLPVDERIQFQVQSTEQWPSLSSALVDGHLLYEHRSKQPQSQPDSGSSKPKADSRKPSYAEFDNSDDDNLVAVDTEPIETSLRPLVLRTHGESSPVVGLPFTVVVIAPPCDRLVSRLGGDRALKYGYSTGGPTLTHAWLSADGFAVFDLSAGPLSFGPAMSGPDSYAAAVDAPLPPPSDGGAQWLSDEDMARVVRAVLSATHQFVIPDLSQTSVERTSARVLVPVVVLKDHSLFDPLDRHQALEPIHINLSRVSRELRPLLTDNTDLAVFGSVHDLHDHPGVYAALHRSIFHQPVHSLNPTGTYSARLQASVDGRALLAELAGTLDALVSGLLDAHSADSDDGDNSSGSGSGDDDPDDDLELSNSPQHVRDSVELARAAQRASRRGVSDGELFGRQFSNRGTGSKRSPRVVPVFVFSLAASPLETALLFNDGMAVHAAPDAVLVLQTASSRTRVPFHANGQAVHVDMRRATRHVLAGLAQSLCAISPPTVSAHDAGGGGVLYDYLWAASRHHPFGPFATEARFSTVYRAMAKRNRLVGALSVATSSVERALARLDAFASRYLMSPLEEPVVFAKDPNSIPDDEKQHTQAYRALHNYTIIRVLGLTSPLGYGLSYIDHFYHQSQMVHPSKAAIKTQTMIRNIHGQMDKIENTLNQFAKLSGLVAGKKERDAEHSLSLTAQHFAALQRSIHSFVVSVHDTIDHLEDELYCCSQTHMLETTAAEDSDTSHSQQQSLLLMFLWSPVTGAFLLSCALLIVFVRVDQNSRLNKKKW